MYVHGSSQTLDQDLVNRHDRNFMVRNVPQTIFYLVTHVHEVREDVLDLPHNKPVFRVKPSDIRWNTVPSCL
jgi:hypothetical protein